MMRSASATAAAVLLMLCASSFGPPDVQSFALAPSTLGGIATSAGRLSNTIKVTHTHTHSNAMIACNAHNTELREK